MYREKSYYLLVFLWHGEDICLLAFVNVLFLVLTFLSLCFKQSPVKRGPPCGLKLGASSTSNA